MRFLIVVFCIINIHCMYAQTSVGIGFARTFTVSDYSDTRKLSHATVNGNITNSYTVFMQHQLRSRWQFQTTLQVTGLGTKHFLPIVTRADGVYEDWTTRYRFNVYQLNTDLLYFIEKQKISPFFRMGLGFGYIEKYTNNYENYMVLEENTIFYLTYEANQKLRKNIILNLGIGTAFRVRKHNFITLELAYQQGLFQIYKDEYDYILNGEENKLYQTLRGSNIGLRIGYQKAILKNKS